MESGANPPRCDLEGGWVAPGGHLTLGPWTPRSWGAAQLEGQRMASKAWGLWRGSFCLAPRVKLEELLVP